MGFCCDFRLIRGDHQKRTGIRVWISCLHFLLIDIFIWKYFNIVKLWFDYEMRIHWMRGMKRWKKTSKFQSSQWEIPTLTIFEYRFELRCHKICTELKKSRKILFLIEHNILDSGVNARFHLVLARESTNRRIKK